MMNKIILAVCSALILAASNELIKWIEKKLNDRARKDSRRCLQKGTDDHRPAHTEPHDC